MKATMVATIVPACVVAGLSVAAKGTTVKLVISGGRLDSPIEITGKDVVFANPWGDSFVAGWTSIPPPPLTSPRYEVSFYEELGPRNVKMLYVVEYSRDVNGRGAIYLPGHGDQRYRPNVSTILRDERDGQWFPASDQWERIVGAHLPASSSVR